MLGLFIVRSSAIRIFLLSLLLFFPVWYWYLDMRTLFNILLNIFSLNKHWALYCTSVDCSLLTGLYVMNNMQGFALQVFKCKEDDKLLSCGMHLALITYTWRNHAHIQTHTLVWRCGKGRSWHTGQMAGGNVSPSTWGNARYKGCGSPSLQRADGSSLQRGPSRQRRLISQAHYPSSTRSLDLPCSALATLSFRV